MNFEQIRLLVKNFDECFRFYLDIMGFKVNWGKEGWSYASFGINKYVKLALFKREAMANAVGTSGLPEEATAQDKVAIVLDARNIGITLKRLEDRGAHFITSLKDYPDWGIRARHLRDPDGNLIEIECEIPKKEWSGNLRKEDKLSRK
jgi:predicted enzyme related to lactoylglutathione lyase